MRQTTATVISIYLRTISIAEFRSFLSLWDYNMEEAKLLKASSGKETAAEASALYQQCDEQLVRLNQQLALHIANERTAKLNSILPDITTLQQQIQQIQASISYEVTQEESSRQQQALLHRKHALIRSIQQHARHIDAYKEQLLALTITQQQLHRQFQDNQIAIQQKETSHHHPPNNSKPQPSAFSKSNRLQTNTDSRVEAAEDRSKASRVDVKASRVDLKGSRLETKESSTEESRWARMDRLFDKLAGLQLSGVGRALVEAAKGESGTIKGVFRNFKANDRVGELAKSADVKQELLLLKARKK